jgi:putative transposase
MREPEPERHYPAPGVQLQDDMPTIVFLTVHTADRGKWLASGESQDALIAAWEEADAWAVGHYLLMPDHLHLFCAPVNPEFSIERWITFWKSRFAKRHRRSDWRWQSRGWHHRLRSGDSYAEELRYVWNNPVRANLVPRPEDWPWQGKIRDLFWRS